MNKPENEMLIAILDINKETDTATYFKSAPFGLNSISANLKGGKLYISIAKWPKKDQAPGVQGFKPTEDDVGF